MRARTVATFLLLAGPASGVTPLGAAKHCAGTLVGGHIFTGAGFETRDLSIRDGRFVPADKGLRTVDASKFWIIPPFVDAHTHTIDTIGSGDGSKHRHWLDEGVFYALNPNNIRHRGPSAAPADNEVEFEAAGGGLTRPGGHPAELYGVTEKSDPDGMEGRAFYFVRDPAQARGAVAKVKANGAAFVKLYLLNHTDAGGGDGMSAESFQSAVTEAKRLGLRPIVHIEDAADFRLAAGAGVFAIMHMPYWPPSAPPKRAAAELMITNEDAEAAARAGIIVVPTTLLASAQFDGAALKEISDVQRHNLELLRAAGVRLAVGEDFIGDMHDEIASLRSFAIFDGAEMMRMATENGAALAFPNRRLGRLADGYEASFLVYSRNPLNNWVDARKPDAGMRAGNMILGGEALGLSCSPPS